MPTFNDPRTDAAEAALALRGLAHASRAFDDPADTYAVLGGLLAGVRSLGQVLDQLATVHISHRARAHDDDGNRLAGAHATLTAADELHQAATLCGQVESRLDRALQHSGRIAWHPATPPERTLAARERLVSRLGGFPDPFARPDHDPARGGPERDGPGRSL